MGTRPDLMFHKSVSSVKTHYILLRVSIQFCFMCLQLYLDAIASAELHLSTIHTLSDAFKRFFVLKHGIAFIVNFELV